MSAAADCAAPMKPLRIGILGAARIAPMALVRPARALGDVEILAVAARDGNRARAFARKHAIARAYASYEELLADADIDAVYNPLPNSHHALWSIRALEAGKHVLCEKPLAANATQAQQMAAAATAAGRVLMEAFHWRYHLLAAQMQAVLQSGELGRIRHIETHFCIPLWVPGDIRYRLDLAGGALMDTGCYAVSILRFLAGAEPEVVRARAKLSSPGVDRYMEADLRFADGSTGRITCSLFSSAVFRSRARVHGDLGRLDVFNPVAPQFGNRMTVVGPAGRRRARISGPASYVGQLEAFMRSTRGAANPTPAAHGVANMRVIDAIYAAAGLPLRRGVDFVS